MCIMPMRDVKPLSRNIYFIWETASHKNDSQFGLFFLASIKVAGNSNEKKKKNTIMLENDKIN